MFVKKIPRVRQTWVARVDEWVNVGCVCGRIGLDGFHVFKAQGE